MNEVAGTCFRSIRSLLLAGLVVAAGAISPVALGQTTPHKAPAPPTPVVQNPNAVPITAEQKESILKGILDILNTKAFVPGVDFAKWPGFIDSKKEEIDKAEDQNAFARIVNRALRDFGISHIQLQTPRAATQRTRRSTVGLGAGVAPNAKGLVVRRIFEGSPAAELKLAENDVIVKVNGEPAKDREALNGEKGTKLKLEVLKADGTTVELEAELKEYSTVRKETLTWVDDETAVLRVFTFATGYGRENIQDLVKEASVKAKFLVLDLRSNGGGSVASLNHLLSLLMPDKTEYGAFVSKTMALAFSLEKPQAEVTPEAIAAWTKNKVVTRKRGDIEPFAGKIAVLINRGSASASEICCAALRESVNAKVVGGKSAGAVLASVFSRLPEGFSLQHPVSDYVTQKGVRLEKNPIVPDVEVTALIGDDGKDPVILKAVEVLKTGTKYVQACR